MVPSVSQRPGSFVRSPDLQSPSIQDALRPSPAQSAEPVATALQSADRVTAASRADGPAVKEQVRSGAASVTIQEVAGYDWRLSPDGKALFLFRPKRPEQPDRQIASSMLSEVEQIYYRTEADLTPETARYEADGAAPGETAKRPPANEPRSDPPAAQRFREADASS